MRVLVAYGSKRHGTEGIAETVGETLARRGFDVDVRPAPEVRSVDGYDAVLVGGALYANRWHRSARRLVKRHARALRERPVWLFSSGPLDDSASKGEIPPTRQVARLMSRAGARGHVTFGGRLEADAKGFPASSMAGDMAGDWRDEAQIRAWAGAVADELAPSA
ncbi:MAG: flavodoxin domain-containing protein [Acidimicrobiia bacterium]|nr:flavodoxin domain-containing protein [Acidimicrobiia bacterium]